MPVKPRTILVTAEPIDTISDLYKYTICSSLDFLNLRAAEIGIINGLEGARGVMLSRSQVILLAETFAHHLGIAVEGKAPSTAPEPTVPGARP